MRQLSGGERRRIALALALGFVELTAHRGHLRCNMIVLDEVLIITALCILVTGDHTQPHRHIADRAVRATV